MSQLFRPLGTGRSHDPHAGLVIERGAGHEVWDTDGRSYIDFVGGYSTLNLGHAHPRLIAVAQDQLRKLSFYTGGNTPERNLLEAQIAKLFETGLSCQTGLPVLHPATVTGPAIKVWLSTTGSRAVEIAWKLAYANRPGRLMRFDLSYHGRSLATAQITDTLRSDALSGSALTDASVESLLGIIPFPRCGSTCDGSCTQCESSLAVAHDWLAHHHHSTSAMILEPAIGARGYYFAPPRYYRRLVAMIREHGVLVISDEVQMGLGRLGAMVVSHADGWFPDLLVLGKSLGGGLLPISAVVGHAVGMDRLPQGIESETFAANPLACRIARETLTLLNDENFLMQVRFEGDRFRSALRNALPEVSVDGRGLASVIDLAGIAGHPAEVAWKWVSRLREKGLLVHLSGVNRDRIVITPPLNVGASVLEAAVRSLSENWIHR